MAEKSVKIQPFQSRFYSIREAAEILRLQPLALWKRVDAKELPAYRPSRHWLIAGDDLNTWLRGKRIG